MKIHLVCAARPNFVKIAPLFHALSKCSWAKPMLIHTGQHYDFAMSDIFFGDFNLPEADVFLGVGSGSHAEQTAGVMIEYEKLCRKSRPDLVVVVGDVNSTLAAALTAKKLGLPVAHLEAGLRSGDRSMPEEINRLATDAISDYLWTPSHDADDNLRREGHEASRISCVGNIMIDSLELLRARFADADQPGKLGLRARSYGVVTLHRPSNVDNEDRLRGVLKMLRTLAGKIPLVFPLHPRTRSRFVASGLWAELNAIPGLSPMDSLGYIQFMSLVLQSRLVITDSGGIQEETTYLGIPCFTLRENTERPITLSEGTNRLVNLTSAISAVSDEISRPRLPKGPPALWDGSAAVRIVELVAKIAASRLDSVS